MARPSMDARLSPGNEQESALDVVCVAGARPNFMKIKPVIGALEAAGAAVTLVHTGQHYDAAMSDVFLQDLGLRAPDHALGVGSGSHAQQTGQVMAAFEPLVAQLEPDYVVVVGDVNSTLACALVAAKGGVNVAHVEAGLRSRDWDMPEEINRIVTDHLSALLFAPSPDAVTNLRAEGLGEDRIHLVGNVMVDTLLLNLSRARNRPTLAELGLTPGRYAVATLHRPANVDEPGVRDGIIRALEEVAGHLPVVLPAHPRARAALEAAARRVRVIEPLGYLDFLALQADAALVLTDSGGIQEETTVLGVPCLTLRENTERPITVEEGTNRVVGRDPDRIIEAARAVLADPPPARKPTLWDGKAGRRIAEVLLASPRRPKMRPTAAPGGPGPVP